MPPTWSLWQGSFCKGVADRVVANLLPGAVDFVLDRRDISHQASLQEAEKVSKEAPLTPEREEMMPYISKDETAICHSPSIYKRGKVCAHLPTPTPAWPAGSSFWSPPQWGLKGSNQWL